jgi:pimeloyl-ACP methyl ester carboxylesterase
LPAALPPANTVNSLFLTRMHSYTIPYRSSQIHYSRFGAGPKLLLCLHGYGESESSFHFLEHHLPREYSAIAIDFPFHGQTKWHEGLSFTIEDLLKIIDAIRIQHTAASARFTLLGFSMGGRIALQILQKIPERIEKVILLAPDGLKVNFWYWLSTQTIIGNRLFSFTMKHPQWFFFLLQVSNRLRIINQSIFKFIRYYLHDSTARRLLYERWTCLNRIHPNLALIKNIIRKHQVPVRLLYGQFDRIIRHERAEKFRHGIESFCTLQIIQAGHQLLQEKHIQHIIRLIQS